MKNPLYGAILTIYLLLIYSCIHIDTVYYDGEDYETSTFVDISLPANGVYDCLTAFYDATLDKHFIALAGEHRTGFRQYTYRVYVFELTNDGSYSVDTVAEWVYSDVMAPQIRRLTLGKGNVPMLIVERKFNYQPDDMLAFEYNGIDWESTENVPQGGKDYYLHGGYLVHIDTASQAIKVTKYTTSGYTTPEIVYQGAASNPIITQKDGIKLIVWQENDELYYSYKTYISWSSPKQLTLSHK